MKQYINISKYALKTALKMTVREHSTIYAVSSGSGKCGVAVIRVSGSYAGEALKSMTAMRLLPEPRKALLKRIYHPSSREIIDRGLVLWFPGPRSFTGEDCCEFQVHGGVAVISAVLSGLQSLPNMRPAKPGEFTRRAFDSGKLNLTEVEGLADLLQAETEMQRKQAFLQTEGALSKLYNRWCSLLVKSVANIEAHIDFEESEDLVKGLLVKIARNIEILHGEIRKHLNNGSRGEILRNGVKTAIIGEPNVGKSSLFNILCQKPAAIVTPIEGTTRDVLESTLDIGGYPVVLLDTAGLRNTRDLIEQEGIKRAAEAANEADLVLLLLDANRYIQWKKENLHMNFFTYLQKYIETTGMKNLFLEENNTKLSSKKFVVVLNKSDLVISMEDKEIVEEALKNATKHSHSTVLLSCVNKNGMDTFLDTLIKLLEDLCSNPTKEHPCMNKERHRYLLNACVVHLGNFFQEIDREGDVVIVAQHLRFALRQLEKLVGNVTTEDLLNVIFKEFCIGK